MKTALGMMVCVLAFAGCAGSFEESKSIGLKQRLVVGTLPPVPSPYCQHMDSVQRNWSAVSESAGMLAGASGIASIPSYGDPKVRVALASATVAMGGLAVAATVVSHKAAETWARDCSQ